VAGDRSVINSLRVFVASPGGLEAERAAVRATADELNLSLRAHGWQVIVVGWEERGPTGGRAQADINADARSCDVFLGILHDRWGRRTGESGSGFEEEWTLALERHQASGRPDLWLYFKRLADDAVDQGEGDDQLAAVLAFRKHVEDGELAFHKTFADTEAFVALVRARLLNEVFERTGLTRTDLGVAINWAAAYEHEPVDLVRDGRTRIQLADELEGSKPAQAAALLVSVADDAEAHGFVATANGLRERACRIWLAAGDAATAVDLVRRLLRAHVWELRAEEADMLLRQLADELPPELDPEVRGWRACLRAPDAPEDSAAALDQALAAQHGFALDAETVELWRAVRWRALIDAGVAASVVADDVELDPKRGGVQLELALLRADALRASGDTRANEAWNALRLLAVDAATERPELAAWIATRAAFDALAREDLTAAEMTYVDAATRWTRVPGAAANATLAFFSAQAAVQCVAIGRSAAGAGARSRASSELVRLDLLRAQRNSNATRYTGLDESPGAALSVLRAATWCYARAGFAHGVARCQALVADAYAALGEEVEAIAIHCALGQTSAAEKLAGTTKQGRAVADRMAESFPGWGAEARFAVLAKAGGHASAGAAARLADEAVAVIAAGEQRDFDNVPTRAAEALAMVSLGVEDPEALGRAVAALQNLAGDERYGEAKAGRLGLRMLHDIEMVDAADVLVARFVSDDRPDEPGPDWVADHINTPQRHAWVRAAALRGNWRALFALFEAEAVAGDADIRSLCVVATRAFVSSNIGMTPDGSGMWGLLALDVNGLTAAATANQELQRAAGERLLVYAADSRWPMYNRVSAVRGIYALAKEGGEAEWLDQLRPLATPEQDLDEQSPPHLRKMWAERGDLEAVALTVCALLAPAEPPAWLDDAVYEGRFDARIPLRVATWNAASDRDRWFDRASARHALRDDSARVRIGAIHAWRRRQADPLPAAELRRLANDESRGVRLALVQLLEDIPDRDATELLLRDHDAYIRGVARKRLQRP
jgi:Domain of unknown function (DUF4062)